MLSIKLIGSSAREVNYYATLGSDYYVSGGEPPGEYWGEGALKLNAPKEVGRKDFSNLLSGYSVSGKDALVQNGGAKNRRAAFDLTWSVPKSVSVAWSQSDIAGRLLIERAGELAVKHSLQVVQDICGTTRRGKAGERIERADLLAAIFRHDTAREVPGELPDPQLHWHTVVCNVVVREDGTTGAFDARRLFSKSMKMALGALFRVELSKELEKLGLSSNRPKNRFGKEASWFELDIVPKVLIEAFSKRRSQIKEWLKKRGLSGGKSGELAATSTRQSKRLHKRSDLISSWREVGAKHGFEKLRIGAKKLERSPACLERKLKGVLETALEKLTDHWSRFTETDLLCAMAEAAQCKGLSISEVRRELKDSLQSSPEIVKLREDCTGETQYTTKEMLALEANLFESVKRLSLEDSHALNEKTVANVIKSHPTIRGEQAEAVRHISLGRGALSCVNGMAGTGKTYLLQVGRKAWEKEGYQVIGTTLAASASKVLQKGSGIKAAHLHSLFQKLESGEIQLGRKSILVLDEAGMVGTRLMHRLLTEVEKAGAKLVLIGDHRQLQAISAGSPFKAIAEKIGALELVEITRQREKWARVAVKELARGEAESALEKFARRGQLIISKTREDSMFHLVRDWHKSFSKGINAAIFAGTRLEVSNLNRLCQFVRKESGELGKDSIEIQGDDIFVGDSVMFRKNHKGFMVRNGSTGTVRMVDREREEITVALEGGFSVVVPLEIYDQIELAYALTTHKGQGQSVEEAFLLSGGSMTDRELSYVQGSRAKGKTIIYTDIESGGGEIESLSKQMNRSRQKDMAHEYILEAV